MRTRLKDERPDIASVLEFLDAIDIRVENDCIFHPHEVDYITYLRRLNGRLRQEYGLDLSSEAKEREREREREEEMMAAAAGRSPSYIV